MKSIIPDPNQLEELAAGLDAGWDDEPAETPSASQPPLSAPPEGLDALDADWDVAAKPAALAEPTPTHARPNQARPSQARPSQARPSPNRTPSVAVAGGGAAPVLASKQERREAERQRRAHEAQQRAANKKQRKAARQAEAHQASAQQRAAEQQRQAEQQAPTARRARPAKPRKRKPADSVQKDVQVGKRATKRERRIAAPERDSTPPSKPQAVAPVTSERNSPKFLIPVFVVLAAVFAVSLGFALSRMH